MRNKYGNRKVVIDDITFASRKEAKYYLYLKQRETDGEIPGFRMQVPYELIPAVWAEEEKQLKTKTKTVRKCLQRAVHYVADFVYTDPATGSEVVVDTKGFRTKEYILKRKMMLAFKGISITEV